MMDFGCHRLEVLVNLFGEADGVASSVSGSIYDREIEDTAVATLHFASGVTATVSVTHATNVPKDTLQIFGTNGCIEIPVLNSGRLIVTAGADQREENFPPAENIHQPLIEDFVESISEQSRAGGRRPSRSLCLSTSGKDLCRKVEPSSFRASSSDCLLRLRRLKCARQSHSTTTGFFRKEMIESANFADATWRTLDVPHDWSIEGPFDSKNPTSGSGGFLPSGVGWYRKHFRVAANQKGKLISIEFDGVMANTDVWINGAHLGKRPNGYVSFGYDLTDKLNFGGDNVISVRVDNSGQPASRWYTGAGIYRHVRLVTTNVVHLEKWSTFVTTPQVNPNEATVKIANEISNRSEKNVLTTVEYKILDSNGKVVARTESGPIAVESSKTGVVDSELKVSKPALWSLETPYLYKAVVTVLSNGRPVDSETVSFGIRSFEFVPATGFWLNGKNFKIKGACLHHDGSAFGAAVPLAVWERRLNELRKLGVNAIRTAHNPPSPEFLDLTDRMGFLVMDELFDQWTGAKNPFDYHKDFNEWSKIDVARYGPPRSQSSERHHLQRRK